MIRPNAELLALKVEIWNLKHPVGTPVTLRLDDGRSHDTVTSSAAQMLSGHSAVIWLQGYSGCQLLDRVTPRATK